MADFSIKQEFARSDFFDGLPNEYVEFLAAHADVRSLAMDQVLFHTGDKAGHFYCVLKGRITVEVAAIEGPPLELQSLGPGAILGWSWLISPNRWAFQARAVEPAEVIEFDGEAVLNRCEKDPAFGYEILKRFSRLMSERLQYARQKMMEAWQPAGFA